MEESPPGGRGRGYVRQIVKVQGLHRTDRTRTAVLKIKNYVSKHFVYL